MTAEVGTARLRLRPIREDDDEHLFPQQFVNVVLLLDTLHGATLIPQAGVQRGAPGTYVYVVNADQTVSVRKVTLGPGDANNVTITAGLRPGDTVVVDGADRLKDGAKVVNRQGGAAHPGTGGAGAGSDAAGTPPTGQRPQGGRRHSQPGSTGGS